MSAPRSKKSGSTAEVSPVEKPTRSARQSGETKRTAKKAPATATKPRTRTARSKATKADAPVAEETTAPTVGGKRDRVATALVLSVLLAVIAAVALAVFLLVRGDEPAPEIRSGVPVTVSSDELASFAGSREAPVYWAGPVPARKLELTTTPAGTFVRYLPLSAPAGDPGRALTIATYPLRNAYATATRRAGGPRMAKRRLAAGGIAVWSRAKPTSIYLAFQGVPQLVEVYAPTPAEARRFALSGGIGPEDGR
jgi:hypothetical protein